MAYYSLIGTCVSILCMEQHLIKGLFIWSRKPGWLGYRDEFCCLFVQEISAWSTFMQSKKPYLNGGTQACIIRGCNSFVDSWNFTNKANSYTPYVEIHTRETLCHFRRCFESEAFLSKKFSFRLLWLEGSNEKIFIRPVSARSRSRFFYMNISHFYELKSGEARSRKPANPVDRAYIKRPLIFYLSSRICGSFIGTLSKTGLTNENKQYC